LILDRLKKVETFVFDVDGVLTNSKVLATENHEMLREFNIKDGFALQFAVKKGYNIIIISGGSSKGVKSRLENLGIQHVYTGVSNKVELFTTLIKELQLNPSTCLYMGDDYPDISVMKMCEIKTCPKDAVWQIQEHCDWISEHNGGEGAIREILETSLTLQDNWESSENSVW
jgi:3-deoxy-D-manno-octulosonate 8-phosphate phosphatase (KDO 8-P phosphatase)